MEHYRSLMLMFGNVYEYIESHHFAYWHKYVLNVNMTYIDCNYGPTYQQIPKPHNTFILKTFDTAVKHQFIV